MPKARRALAPLVALLLLLLSTGCSEKLSRQTGLTDADLLARGEKQAEQKKYKAASESFQVLLERFPTSPLAARAQFGLATNRMANKEEIEAEVAFDDFLRLYPADPKVPDALLMKGDLLSRQVMPPGRDQGKTREAIKAYTLFLEREPGTPRAREVSGKILELRNRLALHEATVVQHYITRKKFESAEARARRAIATYPDVPVAPTLFTLLVRSLEKQGKKDDAEIARKALAEKYPDAGGEKQVAVSSLAREYQMKMPHRVRRGRYEITLQPRYVASKDIDVVGGSKLELDPGLGFGLGFGYNFTNKVALHLDGSWTRADYQAKITTTDSSGISTVPTTVGGTLDTTTVALNLSYYFLDGPLTPFLTGGIGWAFVDSNIPSGPPEGVCWEDPWYGYVCTSYQNTYTKDYFSYNLGVGGRWDAIPGLFLRGSVGWQWVDLGRAETTGFMGGRLD
ncbi:MAG TPA: outer membrane protein assembly factor BamD, partial [Desulfobacteria bacterium]|nr:outer membrane protein assembly factor BamD [Desulfobacteria bacterium]